MIPQNHKNDRSFFKSIRMQNIVKYGFDSTIIEPINRSTMIVRGVGQQLVTLSQILIDKRRKHGQLFPTYCYKMSNLQPYFPNKFLEGKLPRTDPKNTL